MAQVPADEVPALVEVFEASPDKLNKAQLQAVAKEYQASRNIAIRATEDAYRSLDDATRFGSPTIIREDQMTARLLEVAYDHIATLTTIALNLSEPTR